LPFRFGDNNSLIPDLTNCVMARCTGLVEKVFAVGRGFRREYLGDYTRWDRNGENEEDEDRE
jgi:hypothetical protein